MAYCRWSCDDYGCDVYVYASAYGWVTHVASTRLIPDEPMPPPLRDGLSRDEWVEAWVKRSVRVSAIVGASGHENIGLPHDGASFSDPSAGACADRLEDLRGLGYSVPQYAIDDLREEPEET